MVWLIVILTLVAMFEAFFLVNKFRVYRSVPHVGPPIELASAGPLRIGAVYPHHGAVFVRLSHSQAVVPKWDTDSDGEVAEAMRRELRIVPLKAVAEFFVYSLLALFVAGATRALLRRTARVSLRAAGLASIAAVVVLCLEAPLAFRYGTSMWSTLAGPGAFSFSSGQQQITMAAGETIAHRFVLEALNLGAIRLVDLVARPLTYIDIWIEPAETWLVLALRAAGAYAAAVFVITAVTSLLGRLIRRPAISTAA